MGSMFLSVVSCYGNFKKAYFANGNAGMSRYSAQGKEYMVLTNSLLKRLGTSFGQRTVNFSTDKEKMYVLAEGKPKTDYEEHLKKPEEVVTPEKFPIPMATTEWGFLPKTIKDLSMKFFVKSSDLRFPSADEITFEYSGKALRYKIEDVGKLGQEIELIAQSEESKAAGAAAFTKVSGTYLQPVLSALEGNVWLILFKEALIISETDDNHSITYLMGAKKS